MSNFYEMLTRNPIEKPISANNKRAAWDRIQQHAELAAFLGECRAAFGRPESVRIEIEGETIWQQ